MTITQLYLASTSPRRKELLTQIGIQFQCLPINISEEHHNDPTPRLYTERLAALKALSGTQSAERKSNSPVLGADTIVLLNDEILGKPKNKSDAINTLMKLSGKSHQVITSVAIADENQIITTTSISSVRFKKITSREAENYWNTGEPADKAGGYAIQGKAAVFIESIEGSYSGIMGLPLYETAELLGKFGIAVISDR